MLSDLFKAATERRSIGDIAYNEDPLPLSKPEKPAAPSVTMPAITINIVIGDAKKKKEKEEEEELLKEDEDEEEDKPTKKED